MEVKQKRKQGKKEVCKKGGVGGWCRHTGQAEKSAKCGKRTNRKKAQPSLALH